MRFLQSAIRHSARFVVSIQPCAWLFSKNNKVIGGDAAREVIKTVEEHGADIELVLYLQQGAIKAAAPIRSQIQAMMEMQVITGL